MPPLSTPTLLSLTTLHNICSRRLKQNNNPNILHPRVSFHNLPLPPRQSYPYPLVIPRAVLPPTPTAGNTYPAIARKPDEHQSINSFSESRFIPHQTSTSPQSTTTYSTLLATSPNGSRSSSSQRLRLRSAETEQSPCPEEIPGLDKITRLTGPTAGADAGRHHTVDDTVEWVDCECYYLLPPMDNNAGLRLGVFTD